MNSVKTIPGVWERYWEREWKSKREKEMGMSWIWSREKEVRERGQKTFSIPLSFLTLLVSSVQWSLPSLSCQLFSPFYLSSEFVSFSFIFISLSLSNTFSCPVPLFLPFNCYLPWKKLPPLTSSQCTHRFFVPKNGMNGLRVEGEKQ